MPTAHYYKQSFYVHAWQNIVDVNAPLIEIPVGMFGPFLSGFAFENVDGTFTVSLGQGVAVGGDNTVSGSVGGVYRLSSLDNLAPENTIAFVGDWYGAIDVYNAYRSGGDAFLLTLFGGDVHFDRHPGPLFDRVTTDQARVVGGAAGDDHDPVEVA